MTDAIDPRILRRFDVCQKIGQGAYGIVWKAINRRDESVVALKKCFDAFRCDVDAQRTFREVMYLQALSDHDNIIKIQSVLRSENDKDLYITFDYMETDLNQVIKAHILEDIHIRFIVYQLLKALKYIHSAKLLHRDVKPGNLLLDSSCKLKLCDFGLCRSIAQFDGPSRNLALTDYVATRWYRPPEILAGSRMYTEGVDLWAVGCIMGEMYRSRPLLPGTSTMNQLERIFELMGNPTAKEVQSWQSPYAMEIIDNVEAQCRVKLSELCHKIPKDAKHMIKHCLFRLDPKQRGTAESLLGHDFVSDFHNPETEPSYPHGPIRIDINDYARMSADQYRQQLYMNISEKRNEARRFKNEVMRSRGGGALEEESNDGLLYHERRDEARQFREEVAQMRDPPEGITTANGLRGSFDRMSIGRSHGGSFGKSSYNHVGRSDFIDSIMDHRSKRKTNGDEDKFRGHRKDETADTVASDESSDFYHR